MTIELRDHYHKIRTVLLWVLFLNWFVAFAKIFYGLFTHAASITADGFHSLSDGISNIVGLIGIGFAAQPRDDDHPYGHKKYETLFSLAIAAFLFIVCFNLMKEGIKRFSHPVTPSIDIYSFIVMILTLIVNVIVMKYEYRQGKELHSDILVADSLHTRTDILTTLSVIVALIAIKAGYVFVDAVVTMLISLFIAYAAFEILRQGAKVLTDTVAIVDVNRIEKIVLGVKGVQACHKIRSRGREDDIHIDLHAHVSPQMHVQNAHRISHEIVDAIKQSMPGVTDVIVHIEPLSKS